MLKIRMQGTIQDMEWFREILEQQKEIRMPGLSEAYANKGTKRYFRRYAEIERVGGYDENKALKSL